MLKRWSNVRRADIVHRVISLRPRQPHTAERITRTSFPYPPCPSFVPCQSPVTSTSKQPTLCRRLRPRHPDRRLWIPLRTRLLNSNIKPVVTHAAVRRAIAVLSLCVVGAICRPPVREGDILDGDARGLLVEFVLVHAIEIGELGIDVVAVANFFAHAPFVVGLGGWDSLGELGALEVGGGYVTGLSKSKRKQD